MSREQRKLMASRKEPVVESNANENKITILFQLINELSKEVEALDVKQDSNVRKMIIEKFDKLKCLFRPSATSKTPEQQQKCNLSTKETLESMGIEGIETFVIGGRKKKTRRKKLRKNKISLKRKHLKFKKIKGGKRFKITKKKRNKRSRKIYYKKH